MTRRGRGAAVLAAAMLMANGALATSVLKTSGFSNCDDNTDVAVQRIDIAYDNDAKTVTFDVAGTSSKQQKVKAMLNVTAYGQQVYANTFNPCDNSTFVQQLCPVPTGSFAAKGTQAIPTKYANMIPAIAFQVPDIAAQATLQLISLDTNDDVACVTSEVSNGKTTSVAAVTYVAAAVAGAAMILGGATAVTSAIAGSGAASSGGLGTVSPSFVEVFGWFQGMAMNGMMSVNLPPVYRSFSKNFGFSSGLFPWTQLQISIDNFRNATGGNLTEDSVQFLRNATLVFSDGSTSKTSKFKRAMDEFGWLLSRDIQTSVNNTAPSNSSSGSFESSVRVAVHGIQAYAEELSIPSANTFMTVLLIVAIVIAAIAVGILLLKVILEGWALFGNFPKALTGFRKHYWGSIARAITQLILLLYGIWVLYCVYQFTHGDSWAAKTLAGVTLALFTGVLGWFSWKIYSTAKNLKLSEGDAARLYDDKDIWVKYSLFYESYKKDYWWIFVPTIAYLFAKGCCLAAADGHGLAQTIAQLVIEGLMLCVLLWSRPFERKSGNVVNICIQVVRVLSVACILVFVDEFAIPETTQTVAGVVLIAIQSTLTGLLAILIAWNAIVACIKENPHRKRRKEMEKMRDMDNLTPLDARNSLLLDRKLSNAHDSETFSLAKTNFDSKTPVEYNSVEPYRGGDAITTNSRFSTHLRDASAGSYRPLTPAGAGYGDQNNLVHHAAPQAGWDGRAASPAPQNFNHPAYQQGPYGQGGYGGGGGYSQYRAPGGY